MPESKRALISVSDKTGVVEFAAELVKMGIEILSTGGTAKTLSENGIPVTGVSEYTGFPEMLEGRVKTLHPKIHAGLLAKREVPEHMKQLEAHGIPEIDIVAVNLYPFEQTVKKEGTTLARAVENIDIGGPTMLRAAAKNSESVAVIVSPGRYPEIISEMKASGGKISSGTKKKLMAEVFTHTARYDAVIANYLAEQLEPDNRRPETLTLSFEKEQSLRYGENPHQGAAFYRSVYPPSDKFEQLQGKELSFNNLLDLDAAFSAANDLPDPSAVIIKHTNPCGAASAGSLEEAYASAYECDPVSAFGSVVGLNREVDEKTAVKIADSAFVEAVVAPAFSGETLRKLANRKNMRLIRTAFGKPALSRQSDIKKIPWGILVQDTDRRDIEANNLKTVTRKKPSEEEFNSMLFAWKIAKHLKSNAIILTAGTKTVGVGAGQMSRLDSVKIACEKAGGRAEGAVMGSDAFFPFPDGIEEAAARGVTAVIQPGGSLKDKEIIEACDRLGIAMVFTGMRHFKH